MLIDTHSHLMFPEFNDDLTEVLLRAKTAGVEKMIGVGCGIESSRWAVDMANAHEELYATVGLHPYEALDLSEGLMTEWQNLIMENKKIVAVGECGLDYVKSKVPAESQKEAFIRQLRLARESNIPVVVHNRGADEDCLSILKDYQDLKLVFHCYSSGLDIAREIWGMGFYTSFTGVLTYPNAQALREVVLAMPWDKFMIETDCPYLAPQLYRGKRNEPSYVVEVAKKIAELRSIDLKEVEKKSTANALNFFDRLN